MANTALWVAGVRIPVGFDEQDAIDLIGALAARYGWTCLIYHRQDMQERLGRQLTADEWGRVCATDAWRHLAKTARRAVGGTGVFDAVIAQAALECAQCDAALTGPPTATWGLCPTCLNAADLDHLRRQPCAAAGAPQVPHAWVDGRCCLCTMPQRAATPRPLSVVPPAA